MSASLAKMWSIGQAGGGQAGALTRFALELVADVSDAAVPLVFLPKNRPMACSPWLCALSPFPTKLAQQVLLLCVVVVERGAARGEAAVRRRQTALVVVVVVIVATLACARSSLSLSRGACALRLRAWLSLEPLSLPFFAVGGFPAKSVSRRSGIETAT